MVYACCQLVKEAKIDDKDLLPHGWSMVDEQHYVGVHKQHK